jgi:hypothetical protein
VDALGDTATLLKVPLFVAMFLLVRGTPGLLLYRGVLPARDRVALAFFSFPFVGLALRRGRPDRSPAEGVDALPSTAWGTVA